MPNFKQHVVTGLAVGATLNALTQWTDRRDDPGKRFDWGEFFLCSSAAGLGATLPDFLEPADSPNHRGFFHSIALVVLIVCLLSNGWTGRFSTLLRRALFMFGAGYISHILLDATTPRSVALFGLRNFGMILLERR